MDKRWTERIGRRQQQRLAAAFEWAIGDPATARTEESEI